MALEEMRSSASSSTEARWRDMRFVDDAASLRELHLVHQPSDHPTLPVAVHERRAWVDEDLAEVIWRCWRLGIDTYSCCQEHAQDDPRACIDFTSLADAALFYRYVLPGVGSASLSPELEERLSDTEHPQGWLGIATTPYGLGLVQVGLFLRFPRTDIGWVIDRLRAIDAALS